MNDENIIIKTKLNIPGISKNFVARKNIEQKLKYITDYKLTILTAPAGYGKTTTAASILSKSGLLIAWFSLDNEDNDPVRFWNYILAALAEKISSLKVGFDDLSVNRELIESNILAGLIINQLDLLQNKMVLVLDDFHFITNEIIDRSLAYFVQHMPDNFSLIILSRREIDLKLTNMYSKQQVMKLDGSELAFNMDEIEKFYRQRGTRLSLEEVSLMQNYTEGWAAGLVLASLAMEGQKDIHGLSRRFLGSMQIDRLLDEEVFDHWPDEIKDFLVCASFLERFSASLCQAVTGLKDCADILRKLSESNSFIIPLDQQGEWYRYHHLFAEYLQKRLAEKGREYSLSLYRNAGQWYWDNGFKNEAVDAFIKGEDFKKALDLYWHVYIEMSRKGQIPTMLKWLGSIPAKYHKNGPAFCFTYAYLLTMDNQLEAAQKWA
ncbi:MAG TPA: hypothetical protein VN426_11745, partial [Syntrophomonadaceae bacterium]|nr:hypothetical protein [Syntrophomonadaceae bacterium]